MAFLLVLHQKKRKQKGGGEGADEHEGCNAELTYEKQSTEKDANGYTHVLGLRRAGKHEVIVRERKGACRKWLG